MRMRMSINKTLKLKQINEPDFISNEYRNYLMQKERAGSTEAGATHIIQIARSLSKGPMAGSCSVWSTIWAKAVRLQDESNLRTVPWQAALSSFTYVSATSALLFFRIFLATLTYAFCRVKFRISLSNSQKSCWHFYWDRVNFTNKEYWQLLNTESSNSSPFFSPFVREFFYVLVAVMINFICQLDWATGLPDTWFNIFWLCLWERSWWG